MLDSPRPSTAQKWASTYASMYAARTIDEFESRLVRQGLAHFHVSGAGHEITAALAHHLSPRDWLHLHYRDKALLLARGVPPEEFFLSLLAKAGSHSDGRQMSAHFSDRERRVLSIVGPVGNHALQAVGVAAAVRNDPDNPIVLCCLGDGTSQQGEVYEAIAEAVRSASPVLFLVEDNRYSISTSTSGRTFYDLPSGPAASFIGLDIVRVDVRRPQEFSDRLAEIIATMRQDRMPRLCVLDVERLSDHSSSDDQASYRGDAEIAAGAGRDPLNIVRDYLRALDVDARVLTDIEATVRQEIEEALRRAQAAGPPETELGTGRPESRDADGVGEYTGTSSRRSVVMREAIRGVLAAHLSANPNLVLLGQDIEDPKGDVFGVTRGLSSRFPGRVLNSALSESTIVGTAVGRALAGQRSVAFIQFADFIPLALNQIASELATMSWRTRGRWNAPVVLMVSCGGYKPGLGPFHAQTLEAVLAHIPGIDVVMPSSAADAAGLLNNALASSRPTVFLYPKALLNRVDRATSDDLERHHVALGRANLIQEGRELTLVSYGNCFDACLEASKIMVDNDLHVDLIDLRSISPWDDEMVVRSVRKTRRLVVVHEDNRSLGFGAEIVATVAEKLLLPFEARRVTRPDTHIPFNFANQSAVLPSVKSILEACGELIGFRIEWRSQIVNSQFVAIAAIGSGPADDQVVVQEVACVEGQHVEAGETIAVVEATKAAVEIASTVTGTVQKILCRVGGTCRVGSEIFLIKPADARLLAQGNSGAGVAVPILHRNPAAGRRSRSTAEVARPHRTACIAEVATACGGLVVANEQLLPFFPDRTAEDIERLTGIDERRWVAPGETVLSLAVDAARDLLQRARMNIGDIDLVIAATGTPDMTTPSLACRAAAQLANGRTGIQLPAFDINAACSGYLFALASAFDHVREYPDARVLIVTSEVLSPLLDRRDFQTSIIFGDAATATLVVGADHASNAGRGLWFDRPLLSGNPEKGDDLSVPIAGGGFIRMDGAAVFSSAVKMMQRAMNAACGASGLDVAALDVIIPHQANQRIIDALGGRFARPLVSAIRRVGNTSSSSIPLALSEILPTLASGSRVGMVAFGGGFTCAASTAQLQ